METESNIDIILFIVAGCSGMLILVVSIVLFVVYYQKKVLAQENQIQLAENKYQKQLLQATISVEEKERERIAKNIHDEAGTLLNVLKLNMTKISRNAHDKELTERLTVDNLELLDSSIQCIRNISKDLISPTLVKLGYLKALLELCKHITNSGKIYADVIYDPAANELRLPEDKEVQLYRMTQEIINNIIKHADAQEITIEYKRSETVCEVLISHNGKGLSAKDVKELSKGSKGIGLKSIQSRAQTINAKVSYYIPKPGKAYVTIKTHL